MATNDQRDDGPVWVDRPSARTLPVDEEAFDLLTRGYELIIQGIERLGHGEPTPTKKPFRDTPRRAACGLLELVLDKNAIDAEVEQLLGTSFESAHQEMVLAKHTLASGVCPHHLLPVIYRISVAYLPSKAVLGLSKLARLARVSARAPKLQETLTQELAQLLHEKLASRGSAIYVEGLHLCMAARGVGAYESRVVTTAFRGEFAEHARREEFLRLVTLNHPSVP